MADVLVVDDNADHRKLLELFLAHAGYQVTACATAADARDSYQRRKPDLIVADVDMPGETGIAMLIRLRLDDPAFRTPVLFVTGYPERVTPVRRAAPDLVDVLPKPFRREQLLGAVRRYLA